MQGNSRTIPPPSRCSHFHWPAAPCAHKFHLICFMLNLFFLFFAILSFALLQVWKWNHTSPVRARSRRHFPLCFTLRSDRRCGYGAEWRTLYTMELFHTTSKYYRYQADVQAENNFWPGHSFEAISQYPNVYMETGDRYCTKKQRIPSIYSSNTN